jgi:MFS superfamily sulfate permease-like transporter
LCPDRFADEKQVTFTATVVLDVQYGLVVGVAVNFVMLLYWALYPKVILLAETDFQDLNVNPEFFHDVRENGVVTSDISNMSIFNKVRESGKYIILRLMGNINFSNAQRMQEEIESILQNLSLDCDIKTKVSCCRQGLLLLVTTHTPCSPAI